MTEPRYTVPLNTKELMDTLAAARERQAANEQYAATFVCPLKRDEPLSCVADARGPQIPAPHGWIRCPVSGDELCAHEVRYRDDTEAVEVAERLARARRVGLEGKLATATFATSHSTEALDRMREYLTGPFSAGRSLVLTGPTGLGKSWAMACAINELDCPRRFVYSAALANELMSPVRRDEAMARVKDVHFLAWDDLGTEYLKEGGFLDGMFDEIVWTRENRSLPTIFSTNLSTATLKVRLSTRIIDRLIGWGDVFELDGRSERGR